MKRIITVLVVAVLLTVIMPAGLGCGEPGPFEVSGTMETIKGLTDPNPKIENSELTMRSTMYWEVRGSLEGVLVGDFIMVIDTTTGKFTIDGVGTFTGTVNGKSGSYVFSTAASGQSTSPTGESGVITGEQTIISGTGELANLRGSLHSEGRFDKTGITSTYSGTLRFEE